MYPSKNTSLHVGGYADYRVIEKDGRDLVRAPLLVSVFVGPCHHGMARPQVADGGTASDMEGSCE